MKSSHTNHFISSIWNAIDMIPLKSLTVKWKVHCCGTFFVWRLDWIMVLFSWKKYCTVWNSFQNLKPLCNLNIFPTNPKVTPGHFEHQREFLEKKCWCKTWENSLGSISPPAAGLCYYIKGTAHPKITWFL